MAVVFEPRPPTRRVSVVGQILVLVVLAGVVLAVLKPWVAPLTAARPRASADTRPVSADTTVLPGSHTASPRHSRQPAAPVIVRLPPTAAVSAAVQDHDAWGVRLLVDRPGGGMPPDAVTRRGWMLERWQPAAAAPRENRPEAPVTFDETAAVRLVGITGPAGVSLDRVEVDEARPLGRWRTVPVAHVWSFDGRAELLVRVDHDLGAIAWGTGTYRLVARLRDGGFHVAIVRLRTTPAGAVSRASAFPHSGSLAATQPGPGTRCPRG